MSKTDDGEPDVAQLEARIDALEEQYSDETVSDSEGNRISLGGLLNSGLSRRQALKTMALVVSGATLTGAMTQSVAAQNAITGIDQLGEENDRIGTIYAEDIDTDTFTQSTEAIDVDSVTTDELNSADLANASSGAVPTSQGDGTLTMQAPSGVASAYHTSSQTVSNETASTLEIDTEIEDTINALDLSNNQVTVQEDGVYSVSAFIVWSGNSNWSTGDRAGVRIAINNNQLSDLYNIKVGEGRQEMIAPPVCRTLTAGDNISAEFYQESGGDRSIQGGEGVTRLQVAFLGGSGSGN